MKRIYEKKLVPAATVNSVDEGVHLAEAMMAAGLDILEITFRTGAAGDAIQAISERFPEMLLGAGTVLTIDQLDRAVGAGICFAVAPGLNEQVVLRAAESGITFVPGVVTPTEIERAMALGAKLLKFFPASTMGGTATLKALAGPYAHTGVQFVATGGINAANAPEYLALPVVAAVGGSWMVQKDLVSAGRWDEITRLCRDALATVAG